MTTQPEIDPAIVEVAKKAWRETSDALFDERLIAALRAAAPLLVAGERETIERLRTEKHAANSYASEVLNGRQDLIRKMISVEREACAVLAESCAPAFLPSAIAAAIRERGKP